VNYLETTYKSNIKEYRAYETKIENEWGGTKRLFKCVDVQLEIKFCKAEMLFKKSLQEENIKKKLQMIEMMYRAWNTLINKAKDNGYVPLEPLCKCYKYNRDKIAIVCEQDLQLSNLKDKYKNDKDTIIFSIQELFRFVHPDYIEAKETFKHNNIDITFTKVNYANKIKEEC
jgi:NCAIR mutase (PurE)-related protein